jgi:hypothetical protein
MKVALLITAGEIDELGQWDQLENVLAAISRCNLTELTNGALFHLRGMRHTHGTN